MENKENQLFRKKSLEEVSSPERLQEYMRVTSPSVWMILGAVILLLVGLIVCSIVGKIEDKISVRLQAENGISSIVVSGKRAEEVQAGMQIRVQDSLYSVKEVDTQADGSALVYADVTLPDGTYEAEIILETITPIQFLWGNKA